MASCSAHQTSSKISALVGQSKSRKRISVNLFVAQKPSRVSGLTIPFTMLSQRRVQKKIRIHRHRGAPEPWGAWCRTISSEYRIYLGKDQKSPSGGSATIRPEVISTVGTTAMVKGNKTVAVPPAT